MRKYYTITKDLETTLAMYQDAWLASSNDAYMIMIGHYVSNTVNEISPTVNSNILTQNKADILLEYTTEENDIITKHTLTYFILEIDTRFVPSEMVTILDNTAGVVGFQNIGLINF